MNIIRKLHRFRSYCFQVPWCVPPWGWKEFLTTCRCALGGSTVAGPDIEGALNRVRQSLGRRFAIPVGRGRDALWLALRALELGPEDEVVVPSYVCPSVAEAIAMAGARTVWADVGDRLVVTLDTVRAALTPRTRCVIVPHLFGNSAAIESIEPFLASQGIALIDDAAQAFGSYRAGRPLGSFGQFGVVCGGAGKPLVTAAGGMLLMDDPALYGKTLQIPLTPARAGQAIGRVVSYWLWRRWRKYMRPLEVMIATHWGEEESSFPPCALANLDAALLCCQMDKFAANARQRQRRAAQLRTLLDPLHWQSLTDVAGDANPLKLILVLPEDGPSMQDAIAAFAAAGVECQAGYTPCHLKDNGHDLRSLPVTETVWARVLCVPVDTDLRDSRPLRRLSTRWMVSSATVGA